MSNRVRDIPAVDPAPNPGPVCGECGCDGSCED